jgi:hypothetical protein
LIPEIMDKLDKLKWAKSLKQVVKDFHQANIINDENLLENYFH